jgi:hypothetical protein
MKYILGFLSALIVGSAYGQSNLPTCKGNRTTSNPWNNCYGKVVMLGGEETAGEWRNGKLNGKGTHRFPDGSIFVGEFKDNNKNGLWTEYSKAGAVVRETKWDNGNLVTSSSEEQSNVIKSKLPPCMGRVSTWNNCFGNFKDTFSNIYTGEWKDGLYNGLGTNLFFDGSKYVGEFKGGLPNGQGTFTLANGDKYIGVWIDGLQNGKGTMIGHSGRKFVGEFKDGKKNGQGTYNGHSGYKYVGEFKEGLPNGQGTLYSPDGSVFFKGLFFDDYDNNEPLEWRQTDFDVFMKVRSRTRREDRSVLDINR